MNPRQTLATLFAGLEDAPALLLAVSGGPDSMALMRLAVRWTATLAAPPDLNVATVDHGLRPASRDEATVVAETAAALGLPHTILPWLGPKPSTRIQERARAARYALLVDHAIAIGASHIVTAHHADDQAETILMRLTRGSGIGGLAGMRRDSALASGLTLTRPLLGVAKADLVALCRSEMQAFVEDPSNHDPAYARARLRREAAALDLLGFDRPGLLRLGLRMARADAALENETSRLESVVAPTYGEKRYRADLSQARTAEPEIVLRLLRRAIGRVVRDVGFLRLDRLEALAAAIAVALREGRSHRATFAGTRISLDRDGLIDIVPEPSRRRGRLPAR